MDDNKSETSVPTLAESSVDEGQNARDTKSFVRHMSASVDNPSPVTASPLPCERPPVLDTEAQTPAPRAYQDTDDTPPIKVSRSRRRGLLGRLSVIAEITEPKNYPRRTKWFLTFVVAAGGMASPIGSVILFPSLSEISHDLDTDPATVNLSVSFYMLSLAFFPLFWSSFSELLGRRTIYLVSFALSVIFNILSAEATSVAYFIIVRILAGGASASVQAVGAGTIADIWDVHERGRAMGIFYIGPLMGPMLGPTVGGLLQQRWGWRSSMWFLTIYHFVTLIMLLWCLPETLKSTKSVSPVMQVDESEKATSSTSENAKGLSRTRSGRAHAGRLVRILRILFLDPFRVLSYLQFFAITLCVYYACIVFGSLYVLQISIQDTFGRPPYNFTSIQVGLAYLFNSTGYLVASVAGGRWADIIMAREAKKANRYDENHRLVYRPEDRMRENAWIAAFMYPAALIWYGWTSEKQVFWAVPLVANFFSGLGCMLVFGMITTMLTEFMPKRAASGVALNNFFRNIFSCIGGSVSEPLLQAIGPGWLFTGIGVIVGASSIVIWAMKRFGPGWRIKMDEKLN